MILQGLSGLQLCAQQGLSRFLRRVGFRRTSAARAYRAGAILVWGFLVRVPFCLRFEDGRLADHRRLLRDRLFDALDAMNPEEIFVSSRDP